MNIIKNLTPKEKEKPKSGIDEEFSFTVDSANAKHEAVDWDGTVQTEEIAQDPQVKQTDDGEVIELGKFKNDSEVTELQGDTIDISLADIREHPSFFTEIEREELSLPEHHISEEDKESIDRVEEALDDPEYPNNRRDLWDHLCEEEELGIYANQNGELSEAEKDRKAVEAFERQGYDVSAEEPENKSVRDMSGSELQEVMQNVIGDSEPETEELQQNPEPEEVEETEINPVDSEIAEAASEVWSQYEGTVWEEAAEDLQKETEIPNTRIESLGDGFTQVTTQYDELQIELMQLHNRDDKKTKVLDMRDDGTMVARAYEGDLE